MKLSGFSSSKERAQALEKKLGISLSLIKSTLIEDEVVFCENLVGATYIPLGVAGPVHIKGEKHTKEYYIPLATTEGALVASVSRGAKAIALSGGASVYTEKIGVTRGPVFKVGGIQEGFSFVQWLNNHTEDIQKKTKETSSHLSFIKLETKVVGTFVYVRFYFDSQDAMGMNMATIATSCISDYITDQTGIECLALSGNYCIDKKPAFLNMINGRGISGWGEVMLSRDIVKKVLKTTPSKLYKVWLSKCMIGSAAAGSLGFNSHYANIVAAFYAATGQDLAHVTEGSMGITTMDMDEENIRVNVYLPSLMLGTVGGGTRMKIKKEAISMLNITHSDELARVLVAAVLAGEISLLASLSEKSLARVHSQLGR